MISLLIGLPVAITFGERLALGMLTAFIEVIEAIIIASLVYIAVDTIMGSPSAAIVISAICAATSVVCWLVALVRSM